MHFLIDGHNLIAKMPDISLSDPDDEAQLILRLRSWVAASRKRRVTVYFDGGLPGGREPHLSGARLEVVFAAGGRPADDMLIRHIQRVKNPPEYTLVSSDRAIIAAAEKRRMPFLLAQDFAPELAVDEPEPAPHPRRPPPTSPCSAKRKSPPGWSCSARSRSCPNSRWAATGAAAAPRKQRGPKPNRKPSLSRPPRATRPS
jgi:uncharacterized protein